MANTGIYVGLDIGTTSIKVVVAEYIEGQVNIIGVGNAKSEGLSKGIIVDIDKTVTSIKRAIKQAEEKSGIQIRQVSVGLPANLLEVEKCEGMIAVSTDSKEITDEDVRNVAKAAIIRSIPPERQIVTLIPREYKVDGFDGIKDPRGMIGVRLDMSGIVYTGPKTIVHNIRKCIEKAGLQLEELVISPLALCEAILSNGEKEFGTIVIDLGGGQTTTAVIHEGQLKFTHVEQEGGEYVSKDISVVLNTSITNAEALKINYGDAYPERTNPSEEFPVEVVGQEQPIKVDERYLSEIIEARMEQIFTKSKEVLEDIDCLDLPGGIILAGGNASIPGVVELAQEIYGVNVKLHVPNYMGLRNPAFTNAISIVEYVAQLSDIYQISKDAVEGPKRTMARPQVEERYVQPTTQFEPTIEKEEVFEDVTEEDDKSVKKITEKVKGLFSNIFD
ncbi:cell division protein FtsA [Vagococcus xieshaowenii]|uniref:Cell division protein FtsA n=1 Tax=Vagococcus xieshaowenii TaxID=2562451 RepID=A0AAJ5EFT3_9ENTE|nr:cell division protein FtsA [Vagococcus xieshaowenii]QCA28987.1 cell division protein FtsA [Vagococcus xieshaowenii]TFZ43168.1 cell division protein FtsA [Vagococcus xieshaowenii]